MATRPVNLIMFDWPVFCASILDLAGFVPFCTGSWSSKAECVNAYRETSPARVVSTDHATRLTRHPKLVIMNDETSGLMTPATLTAVITNDQLLAKVLARVKCLISRSAQGKCRPCPTPFSSHMVEK